MRFHYFNNGKVATNLGIGAKRVISSLNKIIGLSLFYDFRQSHQDFQQMSVNLEWISELYQLRLNSYFPFGDRIYKTTPVKFTYPGGYWAICQERQKALTGWDAEVEIPIPISQDSLSYIALDFYHYHTDCGDAIRGRSVRLGIRYSEFVRLEVRTSYDSIFKTRTQGLIVLNIPFVHSRTPNNTHSSFIHNLSSPVQRQEIIVHDPKHCKWQTNF